MQNSNIKHVKNIRADRGKSVIDFPERYCMVDIETTGLKPELAEIIEIGAVLYEDGREHSRFNALIKPHIKQPEGVLVSGFISALTGITDDMLKDAPYIENVLPKFEEFLGSDIIMGYNVAFDVNFIYDNFVKHLGRPLKNDFVDVLRLARKVRKDLKKHCLADITRYYGIENKNAHRAVSDCTATNECYLNLKADILRDYGDLEVFKKAFKKRKYKTSARDIKPDKSKFDLNSPIYGRRVSFSGSLRKLNRMSAMQKAADIGAVIQNAVTKKTEYLIISDRERRDFLRGNISKKYMTAEQYIKDGAEIKYMSEGEFYRVIGLC